MSCAVFSLWSLCGCHILDVVTSCSSVCVEPYHCNPRVNVFHLDLCFSFAMFKCCPWSCDGAHIDGDVESTLFDLCGM